MFCLFLQISPGNDDTFKRTMKRVNTCWASEPKLVTPEVDEINEIKKFYFLSLNAEQIIPS